MPPRFTDAERVKAQRMRAEGRSLRDIAAVLGRSSGTVCRALGRDSAPAGVLDLRGHRWRTEWPTPPPRRTACRWCERPIPAGVGYSLRGFCRTECRRERRRFLAYVSNGRQR